MEAYRAIGVLTYCGVGAGHSGISIGMDCRLCCFASTAFAEGEARPFSGANQNSVWRDKFRPLD